MLSINCGGKIIDLNRENALITYVCSEDAFRSMNRMSGMDVFGKILKVEIYTNPIKNIISKDSENFGEENNFANNNNFKKTITDTTKSVITGLFTRREDNVLQIVKNFVKSWNDTECGPDMIEAVYRNKKFSDKDGKAELFITAVNEIYNQKIVELAEKKFNNIEKHIYWRFFNFNYIKTDYNEEYFKIEKFVPTRYINSNSTNNLQKFDENCKSVIKGLNTRKDENVLFYVRKIVTQWKIDPNIVLDVERSEYLDEKSGKAILFVISSDEKWSKRIVNTARVRFNNAEKNVFWLSFAQHKYDNGLGESKSLQCLEGFDNIRVQNSNELENKQNSNHINGENDEKIISKDKLKVKLNKIQLNTKLFASILYDINPDPNNLKYLYETLITQKEKYITNNFGIHNSTEIDEHLYIVNEGLSSLLSYYEVRYGNASKERNTVKNEHSFRGFANKSENKKSIISGVWSDYTDDVLKLVQEEVDSWDEDEVCGDDIVEVGRDAKFKYCNGKVLLFVTAVNKEKNDALIRLAEKNFNNAEKEVIWKEKVVKWKPHYNK